MSEGDFGLLAADRKARERRAAVVELSETSLGFLAIFWTDVVSLPLSDFGLPSERVTPVLQERLSAELAKDFEQALSGVLDGLRGDVKAFEGVRLPLARLAGYYRAFRKQRENRQEVAAKGGKARHEKNLPKWEALRGWYLEFREKHPDMSLSRVAEFAERDEVTGMTYKTIYRWLREINKSLLSA